MSKTQSGLLALLHRANQIATEQFAASLGERDLTARQLHVLAAIEANSGPSQTRIVELTGIDRSTLADIVRRLQKHGLVERRRSREDARAYVLKLSDAGRKALSIGQPALARVEKQMLSKLPTDSRTDLVNSLEQLVGVQAQ